jgi:integral membrane protein (TIGR01906 family)
VGAGADARRGVAATAQYDGGVRLAWLVSIATAFAILGASVAVFLNPVWVGFEQDRVGVAALTGECPATYHFLTDQVLHDLVLGGDFDAKLLNGLETTSTCATFGGPLAEAERSHMRDVRGVFQGFFLLVLGSLVVLSLSRRRATLGGRLAWWRAVRRGAAGLAGAVAVLGVIALVAFDAVFEVFHRLFFAAGTYSFDPRTSLLIQLFPDQFWSETTIAVGIVAITLAAVTWWFASQRIAASAGAAPMAIDDPARQRTVRIGEGVR